MTLEHIPRWTHASIKDTFKRRFSGSPIYFEGENDPNSKEPFYIEVRIDGPTIIPLGTKSEYMGVVEINLLITAKKDQRLVHIIQDKIGLGLKLLKECILVRKLGSEDTNIDDGSSVTVLQPMPDEALAVALFGQVDPATQVQQASVEGHFRMQLEVE
jgi:hypothetical protein